MYVLVCMRVFVCLIDGLSDRSIDCACVRVFVFVLLCVFAVCVCLNV